MLSVVFSLNASAETIETKNLEILQQSYLMTSQAVHIGDYIFRPNNGDKEWSEMVLTDGTYGTMIVLSSGFKIRNNYTISYTDASYILEKGKSYKINLSNFYFSTLVQQTNSNFYANQIGDIKVIAIANDGTQYTVVNYNTSQSNNDYINNTNSFDLSFDFEPQKPIKSFLVIVNTMPYSVKNTGSNYVVPIRSYLGEWNEDNKFSFSLEVESQEAGLLKGVIQWLQNIKNGITDLFDSITELPSKIWSFIENGLKSLFVPSEEFIVDFKDRMSDMLAEKLGAVYQVLDITLGSWDRITANDNTNTIQFPKATINLPNNETFSFGGYTVQIVPIGFEFIATALKTIVGIVCTILFVNGLRKRYDEIMGVEQ